MKALHTHVLKIRGIKSCRVPVDKPHSSMFVNYNIARSEVLMHKYKVCRKGGSKSYIFEMHFWIGVEFWPFLWVLKPKCDERLDIRGSGMQWQPIIIVQPQRV